MALALRRLLGSAVQKPNADNTKCDLYLVFERAYSSPASSPDISPSPPSQKDLKRNQSLFELIAKGNKAPPTKKLHSCPQLEIIKSEKKKQQEVSFLMNSFAVTTDKYIELPEEFGKFITFEFIGSENQQEAWEDFKSKVKDTRYSIISCANIVFSFDNGKIKAKAITGTAQRKLEAKCTKLPDITFDEILALIEPMIEKERLVLYSSEMFYYSAVKPIRIRRTEFESVKGKKYRITLVGNIFPYIAADVKKKCEAECRVSVSSSVVF